MNKIIVHHIIVGLLIVFSFNGYSAHSSSLKNNTTEDVKKIKQKNNEQKQITAAALEEPRGCKYWLPLFRPFCYRLHQIWKEGNNELYISGYTWHNRFTYSAEQLRKKHYNELAWGGGFGKGFFDEKGNWHGLYAFAFLDSHRNLEPIAGYAYLKVANLTQNFKAGLGFSVFLTSRPDIFNNIPFPGAVPWLGVFYKNASIKASYVPGSSTNGNVLYLVGTYSFDK